MASSVRNNEVTSGRSQTRGRRVGKSRPEMTYYFAIDSPSLSSSLPCCARRSSLSLFLYLLGVLCLFCAPSRGSLTFRPVFRELLAAFIHSLHPGDPLTSCPVTPSAAELRESTLTRCPMVSFNTPLDGDGSVPMIRRANEF